ncbi:MAG: DNA repair protein RecN, partial [Rubrivivax sp.]
EAAQGRSEQAQSERDRLAWQIAEVDKLAPEADEWERLNAEHQRLAHGQALLDNSRSALQVLADDDTSAVVLCTRAIHALDEVQRFDAALAPVADALRSAQAQLDDAAHTLRAYLGHAEPDPGRLTELDDRIGVWVSLARRHRRSAADLPELLAGWKDQLAALDAATDLDVLQQKVASTLADWQRHADALSAQRRTTAPKLADAVTQAMQQLGMSGGRFEIALLPQDEPQSWGLEAMELRVAGHAGSTPRALAKVASGGELSRLALAIAVTTAVRTAIETTGGATGNARAADAPSDAVADSGAVGVPTLIFDEIDAGVGGTVADSVGRLMKQLGRSCQVLAVTHLAQVAACADGHFVVSKALQGSRTVSQVVPVEGVARVTEIARMLGGERLSGMAHAQTLLGLQPAQDLQK